MSHILILTDIDLNHYQSDTAQVLALVEGFARHADSIHLVVKRHGKHPLVTPLKHKNVHLHTWSNWRSWLYVAFHRLDIIYVRYPNYPTKRWVFFRLFSKARFVSYHPHWLASAKPKRWRRSRARQVKRQIRLARQSHAVHIATTALKDLLIANQIPEKKIIWTGNGSATHKIYPIAHELAFKRFNLDPDFVYLGFVGHLDQRQDLATVLRALAQIKHKNPDIRLIIAGEGPALRHLHALCDELDLTEQVLFLGLIPHEDLNMLLNSFDIAIAPFRAQDNHDAALAPLKLSDYAAAGLVTITADLAALAPQSDHTPWLFVYPPEEAGQLAQLILQLVDQSGLRASLRLPAREYAQQYLDWKQIGNTLIKHIMQAQPNLH
jgi:glycosyltransferase involved in cell wall biosynthesis